MNTVEVSMAIKEIVQQFKSRQLTREEAINDLKPLIEKHPEKVFDGDSYTFTLQQKLGKRRMPAFEELISEIEGKSK